MEQKPIEIPPDKITPEVLEQIIESFILREGTDYGIHEASFDSKKNQIKKQIDQGHICIIFDFTTESVTLMTQTEWRKSQKSRVEN